MFWKDTGDGYLNMREKLNVELDFIHQQYTSGELVWSRDVLESLVERYPAAKDDEVLAKHGDVAGHMENYLEGAKGFTFADTEGEASSSDSQDDACDAASAVAPTAPTDDLYTAPADSPGPCMHTAPADSPVRAAKTTVAAPKAVLSPLQAERVASIEFQHAGLLAAMEELKQSGNPVSLQKLKTDCDKLCRQRRSIMKAEPEVAEAFRQNRSLEFARVREQQRMLADINATDADRKRRADDLRALKDDIAKKRKTLEKIERITKASGEAKRFTPSFLGKGRRNCGGKDFAKRRKQLLDQYALLGDGLSPPQLANFDWFKDEYDAAGLAEHREEWPELFLKKLKGVLDQLANRGDAFSRFVYDEERLYFEGAVGLTVPPPGAPRLALQN